MEEFHENCKKYFLNEAYGKPNSFFLQICAQL
jgi:hypothetical protein